MGRLKQDHSGWSTHGKWLKYQQPTISEKPLAGKSRKDTNKWCKGKVGVEHTWHRYQYKRWNDERLAFTRAYIKIKCIKCRKEKYIKTARGANFTLHLFITDMDEGYVPVQVRVNGKILPIAYAQYRRGKYWCNDFGYWH